MIAQELVSIVKKKLKKEGKKEIIADVYAHNKVSLRFFEKMNFAKQEEWYILIRKIN